MGELETTEQDIITAEVIGETDIDRLIKTEVGRLPHPDGHEHIVDINNHEIQAQIWRAREIFSKFEDELGEKFDLTSEEGINEVLRVAKERGIYREAEQIRNLIYGKNISIYGVSYLSNVCNQNCKYCPMGVVNWENWLVEQQLQIGKDPKGEDLSDERRQELTEKVTNYRKTLRTMSIDEAKEDYQALVEVGHTEICILSGEEIGANLTKLWDYTQAALDTPGVREVILNMGSYDDHECNAIIAALDIPEGKKLQFRIFQETFNPNEYSYYMENAPLSTDDSKHDMVGRFYAQERAVNAGFDEVGIGVLFGLSKNPLEEIDGLQRQADLLTYKSGKEPKRCALPFGNEPENQHVDIKYRVSKLPRAAEITELIYALTRLAMPTVSVVSSERDEPELLKKLDKYANHTTLFVHPGPKGNIESLQELATHSDRKITTVEQAKVTRRFPDVAIRDWQERGYNILGFDWQKYVPEAQK